MKSKIGIRMKEQYESRSKTFLTRRCPVIIRLDGKAFHTYTKGLNKPFDEGLMTDMQETAKYLCENIQGCKAAYIQSDEISLLLTDYDSLQTQAWFNYSVQKMCSVSASIATAKLNQLRLVRKLDINLEVVGRGYDQSIVYEKDILDKLAMFDSRCFSIADKEEVVNYFVWRQQDAVRNSISMLAQSLYSHKDLHGLNSSEQQEVCFQKGYSWNDLSVDKKRGCFIVKQDYDYENKDKTVTKKSHWIFTETPNFSKDRNSILKLI